MAKLIDLQTQCAKIAAEVHIYIKHIESNQIVWEGECQSIAAKVQQVGAFLTEQESSGSELDKKFIDACYQHKTMVWHISSELKKIASSLSALEKKDIAFTKAFDKLQERINTFMLDSKNSEYKPVCLELLEQIVKKKQELVGLRLIKVAVYNKIDELDSTSNDNKQRLHKILTRINVSQALLVCKRLEDKVHKCEEAIPSPRSIDIMLGRIDGVSKRLIALRSVPAGVELGVGAVSPEVISTGVSVVGAPVVVAATRVVHGSGTATPATPTMQAPVLSSNESDSIESSARESSPREVV